MIDLSLKNEPRSLLHGARQDMGRKPQAAHIAQVRAVFGVGESTRVFELVAKMHWDRSLSDSITAHCSPAVPAVLTSRRQLHHPTLWPSILTDAG